MTKQLGTAPWSSEAKNRSLSSYLSNVSSGEKNRAFVSPLRLVLDVSTVRCAHRPGSSSGPARCRTQRGSCKGGPEEDKDQLLFLFWNARLFSLLTLSKSKLIDVSLSLSQATGVNIIANKMRPGNVDNMEYPETPRGGTYKEGQHRAQGFSEF
jgi:hypothetical protein